MNTQKQLTTEQAQQTPTTIPHATIRRRRNQHIPHPPASLRVACAFIAAAIAYVVFSPGKQVLETLATAILGSLSHTLAMMLEIVWEKVTEKVRGKNQSKRRLWATVLSGVVISAFIAVGIGKQLAHG